MFVFKLKQIFYRFYAQSFYDEKPIVGGIVFFGLNRSYSAIFHLSNLSKKLHFLTFLQWLRNSSELPIRVFFIILMDPDSGASIWIQKFRNRYVENQIIQKIKHVKATIKF